MIYIILLLISNSRLSTRNVAKRIILSTLIHTTGRYNYASICQIRSLKLAKVGQIVRGHLGAKWHSLSGMCYSTELGAPLE